MTLTRDQTRAKLAHEQVSGVLTLEKKKQKQYRTITRKAQALIRNAGLCQALHFIESKDDYKLLNEHLTAHLARQQGFRGNLLEAIRTMELSRYLATTREVLACLTWQCRMVDALLGDLED